MVIDPSKTAKCNFYQNMAVELTKIVKTTGHFNNF